MITSKNLITSINDVPSYWVFEYYCKLPVKLTGQTEKIKSLFNPNERTASFAIYVANNQYWFNDFSSGIKGDKVTFVSLYYNLTAGQAINKIIEDYRNYLNGNTIDTERGIHSQARYNVDKYTRRGWTKQDAEFWLQFNINSSILQKYNVMPVSDFVLERDTADETTSIKIISPQLYMYTRIDGSLYKIYQPQSTKKKFLKLRNYIQGTDQLKFEKPNLIIASSLKDIMCLTTFGFNAEFVAPDSENTMIPSSVISVYRSKYKNIITLFDNDDAGKKAMLNYESTYGLPGVILPLSKDPSDSVRDYGLEKTREVLYPLLKEAINK